MPENTYFDELLDNSLKRYAQAEPLAGFEERVLAGLDGREVESDRRMWWFWSAAVTAAMAVTMFVMVSRQQTNVTQTSVETAKSVPTQEIARPQPVAPTVTARVAPRVVIHSLPNTEQTSANAQLVKRDVFPSPAAITAEERMLMAYLKHTPVEELAANSKPDEPFVMPKGDTTEMNQVLPGDAGKSTGVNTK